MSEDHKPLPVFGDGRFVCCEAAYCAERAVSLVLAGGVWWAACERHRGIPETGVQDGRA